MLAIWFKKTDYDINITEIENKLNNHYHDKYITNPEFNTLAAVFNAKLSQANSVAKTIFDLNLIRVILKKMVHKII